MATEHRNGVGRHGEEQGDGADDECALDEKAQRSALPFVLIVIHFFNRCVGNDHQEGCVAPPRSVAIDSSQRCF